MVKSGEIRESAYYSRDENCVMHTVYEPLRKRKNLSWNNLEASLLLFIFDKHHKKYEWLFEEIKILFDVLHNAWYTL